MIKRKICTAAEWDATLENKYHRHILQSSAWATFKSFTGWKAQYLLWYSEDDELLGGVSILEKISSIPLIGKSIRILYAPRGPVLSLDDANIWENILEDMAAFAKEVDAVYIKIDPEIYYEINEQPQNGYEREIKLKKMGWQIAPEQIQFKNTFWLDLTSDEEALLSDMKQKTRYNIRLAGKKGVQMRIATPSDFHLLYRMYAETARRDGFIIRSEDYYVDLWQQFYEKKIAYGLIAEVEGEVVAGMILFIFEQRAWYFYGMSTEKYRNYMPTYLLQWEAIRLAKQMGCMQYDLWGAPDEMDEKDSMYGVYRFKVGLGAELVKGIGAWDFVVHPFRYRMISTFLPQVLSIMRMVRRRKIKKELTSE